MESTGSPVAVYCITRGRLELVRKSLKMLRNWAGMPIKMYVVDNGSDRAMLKYLRHEKAVGHIHWLHVAKKNLGQNIAANLALDQIEADGPPDLVLRWDPDALPRTRRFLKKLVSRWTQFHKMGVDPVVSPQITMLKHPPKPIGEGDDTGFKYELVQVLGGICRLHPWLVFAGWRFNKFGALGFGEALEMADRCYVLGVPKLRLPDIMVEHAYGEDGQAERWPKHFTFEAKEIPRYVGYGL